MSTTESRARHWQLFTSMPGSEAAAKTLDNVLDEVETFARAEVNNGAPVKDALISAAKELMLPAMERLAEFGAEDSEPLYVLGDELTRIASKMAGASVVISRWDW